MEDILLLIFVTYSVSLIFGYLLRKYFRIPWMFAALFFGLCLSTTGLFRSTVESETFRALMSIGMFLLLFLLGFNLNLKRIGRLKHYIIAGALLVIIFEGLLLSLTLYFLFPEHVGFSYARALVVALSFATVGEVLLPILTELGVARTTFGQLVLGIGALDDILEVLMIVSVALIQVFEPSFQAQTLPPIESVLLGLALITLPALIILRIGGKVKSLLERNDLPPFVFLMITLLSFFFFVALGYHFYEGLAAVGAIFSGIASRSVLPKEKFNQSERVMEFLGYVFLSPIFFLGVGYTVSITSILLAPLLIITVSIFATLAKCLASLLALHKILGIKYSLLAGVGLSIRFSTSLAVQFILLRSQLISLNLYSALVATMMVSNPVIIMLLSWKLAGEKSAPELNSRKLSL